MDYIGNSFQMHVLREQLKQARCKIAAQAADLEKAKADADVSRLVLLTKYILLSFIDRMFFLTQNPFFSYF